MNDELLPLAAPYQNKKTSKYLIEVHLGCNNYFSNVKWVRLANLKKVAMSEGMVMVLLPKEEGKRIQSMQSEILERLKKISSPRTGFPG